MIGFWGGAQTEESAPGAAEANSSKRPHRDDDSVHVCIFEVLRPKGTQKRRFALSRKRLQSDDDFTYRKMNQKIFRKFARKRLQRDDDFL